MFLFKFKWHCLLKVGCIVFIVFYLQSCGSQKILKNETAETAVNSSYHQIIFLTFEVYKQSENQKDSLVLSNTVISEGILKYTLSQAPTIPPGKWRCSFLDVNKDELKSTLIDDPLIKHHEYVTVEDGKHKLANKIVYLKKSGFVVRARYKPDMKYVLLEKTDSVGNKYVNKIFKINIEKNN